MVLKYWRNHLKIAKEAFVTSFNKRRSKANSFVTLDYCKIDDNKLNRTNTSNMENDFQIWFWNESVNKSNLDSEKENNHGNDKNNKNLREKHLKTKKNTSSKVLKQELK